MNSEFSQPIYSSFLFFLVVIVFIIFHTKTDKVIAHKTYLISMPSIPAPNRRYKSCI